MTTTPNPHESNLPPSGWPAAPQAPVRKRRHIFRWVFLAIQVLFLVWIISGVTATGPDCGPNLSPEACQAAQGIGTGIGVALIIGLWIAVDLILGITYLIFRKR